MVTRLVLVHSPLVGSETWDLVAADLGSPIVERASHHLAPLTHPDLVTESLRELLGQLRP
jgi:hypothetical protein